MLFLFLQPPAVPHIGNTKRDAESGDGRDDGPDQARDALLFPRRRALFTFVFLFGSVVKINPEWQPQRVPL